MNKKYLNILEYNKILNLLANFSQTYLGKDLCLSLNPSYTYNEVLSLLNETNEATSLIEKNGNPPLSSINDISAWIKFLNSNLTLSISALLQIARILKISNELKNYFSSESTDVYPILSNMFNGLYINSDLEKLFFLNLIDDNTVSDSASSKLSSLRRNQKNLEQTIKAKLNSFIHSSTYSKYIQEPVITIRNERYVIPIKEEYRSQIKGFMHDVSSSGSTVFIEPMTIFDLNNEINNLKIEENLEIEKILQQYTSKLVPIANKLHENVKLIGKLDFIFSKAKFSLSINGIKPILNTTKQINLVQARHPLIDKNNVVPIDINLGLDYSCLVITGPNTGGKTVTLKTTGILCIMAMSGLNIPANPGSSIYVFDNIFAEIGDEQSIQESLSTFSSHMLNIIEILKVSTHNSLILLDELGSGTDPIEGSSLAISILEALYKKGCLIISTTHYSEIKHYALTNARI